MTVEILDQDNLLRRIPTYIPSYIKPDGTISSMAFAKKRDEDGISVDLERLSSYEKATLDDRRYRLLRINAGVIHNNINDGLNVVHDPQPNNKAHCLITGNITESKKSQLRKNALEVVERF